MTTRSLVALLGAALLLAAPARAVDLNYPQGDLHGFPSMSDEHGKLVANGELTQKKEGARLLVHAVWRFRDGRIAVEDDVLSVVPELAQESFRWVETRGGKEERRYEVNFKTGQAKVDKMVKGERKHWDEKLDLPAGKSFTGYSTALAVSQERNPLAQKNSLVEITFVAFTPKPRTVTLQVSRSLGAHVRAAGRELSADLYTLHPKIPFPINVIAGAKDAHLWFTHSEPPALLRAEQNLVEKDDPIIRIDVIPRGNARPSPQARRGPR